MFQRHGVFAHADDVFQIDEVGFMDAAKLVAAQLVGKVFDGAALGVGVAGFGVEGELVVEAFCVENVVQAQAHALAAVAEGEGEGAALAGEAFSSACTASVSALSCTGLRRNHTGLHLKHSNTY